MSYATTRDESESVFLLQKEANRESQELNVVHC
jgi:hypothetical protein